MTAQQANEIIKIMYFEALRTRSVLMENSRLEELPKAVGEEMMESLNPWLFGPKSIIPALQTQWERIEAGENVKPGDLYNFCIVARQFEPVISISLNGLNIPDPDANWLKGWDKEEKEL